MGESSQGLPCQVVREATTTITNNLVNMKENSIVSCYDWVFRGGRGLLFP